MLQQELLNFERKYCSNNNTWSTIKLGLQEEGGPERWLKLDMEMLLGVIKFLPDKSVFFSNLIQPYIEKITCIKITNLYGFLALETIFPHFFNRMDKLKALNISFCKSRTWCLPSKKLPEKFPDTLTSLSLERVPLQSFSNLKILTKFSFTNLEFSDPLDALFTFLRGNPLLERVELTIGPDISICCCTQDQAPINLKKLQFLMVNCLKKNDIAYLVSYIPPPKGAEVKIFPEEFGGLDAILPHLGCVAM